MLQWAMQKRRRYTARKERGLFDAQDRLAQIDSMGDPLADLDKVMDWDIFSPVLDEIPSEPPKGPGGRPAFHPLFMFKVLVVQALYGLGDEQAQLQILDRRSFHRFLDITEADLVPDQNTIRGFREKLNEAGLEEKLFEKFNAHLESRGFITKKGNIIDASFVEVPRQRNSRAEDETIKGGGVPEGWEEDPKRLAHKDLHAKWAKKNQGTFYGYKNHVNADRESKLITRCTVTDAAVHDSKALGELLREGDPETWLDAGYAGGPCAEVLAGKGVTGHVCEKGSRGKPLTKSQRRANRKKSRVRARVEHIFGFLTNTMGAMCQRAVGYARNRGAIIFSNLVYNMARCEQIVRLKVLGRRTPKLG